MSHTGLNDERWLKQAFVQLNKLVVLEWRLGMAPWFNVAPPLLGRFMVLIHTGRKTGRRRLTPLNYTLVEGDIYCIAGFGIKAAWYRNIMANPQVEVWLPDGWWVGVVEDVSEADNRLPIMRQMIRDTGWIVYRLLGLNPFTASDAELDAATSTYRLLRIRRTAACTGPNGPGELAWVWPLVLLVSMVVLLRCWRVGRRHSSRQGEPGV